MRLFLGLHYCNVIESNGRLTIDLKIEKSDSLGQLSKNFATKIFIKSVRF